MTMEGLTTEWGLVKGLIRFESHNDDIKVT